MSDAELQDSWRQLGMEVIVTMSETAPAMVRKYSKFIPLLGQSVYSLLVSSLDFVDQVTLTVLIPPAGGILVLCEVIRGRVSCVV